MEGRDKEVTRGGRPAPGARGVERLDELGAVDGVQHGEGAPREDALLGAVAGHGAGKWVGVREMPYNIGDGCGL